MGIFSSKKQWGPQARVTERQRKQRKAARYRSIKAAKKRNRKHALEHPASHAWSLFRTRNW